uniref:CRAL/TRIO N-terminal domain-containing protein n=1 Tax=Cyprinodon variegatus TaxID=28743 RepID=A0A3Q2DXS2_CYPVA
MSGRIGDLSPKQAESLTEFRERIQDVLHSLPAQHDHYLLRWLRARNFNVQKAENMIRKHVEFRKKQTCFFTFARLIGCHIERCHAFRFIMRTEGGPFLLKAKNMFCKWK